MLDQRQISHRSRLTFGKQKHVFLHVYACVFGFFKKTFILTKFQSGATSILLLLSEVVESSRVLMPFWNQTNKKNHILLFL